jgi:hypothetical protein
LSHFRTEEEVERILGFAKLTSAELKPNVQCISFKTPMDHDAFSLMEMEEKMIQQLAEGQKCVNS